MEKEPWDLGRIARFLFEGAMLKKIYRTGYPFLGKGKESVAAHSFGVMLAAFVLAHRIPDVDLEKVLKLCLIHDLPEARTGDANAVHKRYVTIHEDQAAYDLAKGLPFSKELCSLLQELREQKTLEAIVTKDADQLDMLISLKEHLDTGSKDAGIWIPYVEKRLKTPEARQIAKAILEEHWASWWMNELIGRHCEKTEE